MKIACNMQTCTRMHFFSQINRDRANERQTLCRKWSEKCGQGNGNVWCVTLTATAAFHRNFVYCVFVVKIIYTCINLHLESSYTARAQVQQPVQNEMDKTTTMGKYNGGKTHREWRKKRQRRWRRNKWPSDIKTFTARDCSFRVDLGLSLFPSVYALIFSSCVCNMAANPRKKIIKNWKENRRTDEKKNDSWNCWQNKSTNGEFSWVNESIREPIAATVVSFAFCRSFCVCISSCQRFSSNDIENTNGRRMPVPRAYLKAKWNGNAGMCLFGHSFHALHFN